MEEYNRKVLHAIRGCNFVGMAQSIVGVVGSFMFFVAWCVCVADGMGTFFVLLFGVIALMFALLGRKGSKRRKLARLADAYWLRLQTDPARSLQNLAERAGHSYDKVKRNISAMIKFGIFPNAQINGSLLILPPEVERIQTTPPIPAKRYESTVQKANISCTSCGANNSGYKKNCEYCGSPL